MNNDFKLRRQPSTALYTHFLVFLMFFFLNSSAFAHGWKSPEKDAKVKNPVKYSKTSVSRGQETYLDVCSNCHGENASGGDPVRFEGKMVPPNLVKRLVSHSDGDFFWKIQNGRDDMPAFKEDLEPEKIWDIIHFIRSLTKE